LYLNLRTLLRSKPLVLSVLGIAFFTFMVAFMRVTMYMHGETRNPQWEEFYISLVVGTVAIGIGLGSPLAGWLSGGKVELGLVPLGAVGMFLSTAIAAFWIDYDAGLIGCLIALGFCVGFYFVPLYALLQHRAPKTSKGDLIATSNFINVVGAIAATLLFRVLVEGAHLLGVSPRVEQKDLYQGQLVALHREGGRPKSFRLRVASKEITVGKPQLNDPPESDPLGFLPGVDDMPVEQPETERIVEEAPDFLELMDKTLLDWSLDQSKPVFVTVSSYQVRRGPAVVQHYRIRPSYMPQKPVYNDVGLPRYLFFGASIMTLGIVVLLCRQLPDFFVRSLLWLRSFGRYHVRVYGIQHLPDEGAAILATNCRSFQDSLHVQAATDRNLRFLLIEEQHETGTPLLRFLAKQTGMIVLQAGQISARDKDVALIAGSQSLDNQHLVALSSDGREFEDLLTGLQANRQAPIIPVYCGRVEPQGQPGKIRVAFGDPLPATATPGDVRRALLHLEGLLRHIPPGSGLIEPVHH
jgi:1-acyl-sn-glycerol-3-phosphate acyltransferase